MLKCVVVQFDGDGDRRVVVADGSCFTVRNRCRVCVKDTMQFFAPLYWTVPRTGFCRTGQTVLCERSFKSKQAFSDRPVSVRLLVQEAIACCSVFSVKCMKFNLRFLYIFDGIKACLLG